MDQKPSLRPGLLRHRLDNELLVYDTKEEQVHLLNPTTFAVVEMMEEGIDSETMASRLGAQNNTDAGADILALALDELAKAKLLETSAQMRSPLVPDGTRRQMIQRAAGLGAALLIPAIVTLTPRAASAATNVGIGGACANSFECVSACCQANASGGCVAANNGTCVATGSGCCKTP